MCSRSWPLVGGQKDLVAEAEHGDQTGCVSDSGSLRFLDGF